MAKQANVIKCKHCDWITRKWGRGSSPGKAFTRLIDHIRDEHPKEHAKTQALAEAHEASRNQPSNF
jgi:hypothetical protein